MANAFSLLRKYGDYIEPFDSNLILKALEHKQTKFDANMTKLQSQVDEFASIDLLRPVDKEYFNKRIGHLVDDVNGFAELDLSNAGVTRAISSHIRQALDPNVMGAISSTQAARNTVAQINEVKSKHPDQYAVQNEMFATQKLQEWANSTELGATYSGESYTPYHDYQKEMMDVMGDLHNLADVREINRPDGGKFYINKRNERMSEFEVRQIAEGLLSVKARQQLQIDGWYNYGNQPVEALDKNFGNYVMRRNSGFDATIAQAENQYKNTNNPIDGQKVQEARALKASFNGQAQGLKGNKLAMGQFLQTDRLMGALTTKYGFDKYKEDWSTNSNYYNDLELQAKEKAKTPALIDTNEDGIPDFRDTRGTTGEFDETNSFDKIQGEMEVSSTARNSGVNSWFDGLGIDQQRSFAKEIGQPHPNSLSANEKFDLFRIHAKNAGNDYQSTLDAHYKYTTQLTEFDEISKTAYAQVDDDVLMQVFNEATSLQGSNNVIVYNGQRMTTSLALVQAGIDVKSGTTEEQLNKLKTTNKSLYNQILANAYSAELKGRAVLSMGTDFTKDKITVNDEDYEVFKSIVRNTNPNKTFNKDDYFTTTTNGVSQTTGTGERNLLFAKRNTLDIEKFKTDFPEAYTMMFNVVNSGKVPDVTRPRYSMDRDLEAARNQIAFSKRDSEARAQDVVIQGGTSASKMIANIYATDPNINVDIDGTKDMRLVNDGRDFYISQRVTTGTGKNRESFAAKYKIDVNDLPAELAAFVNTSRAKSAYDARANTPIFTPATRMESQSNGTYQDYKRFVKDNYQNSSLSNSGIPLQELQVLSTREGSMDNLSTSYPQYLGTRFEPTDMRHLVNTIQNQEFDISAVPNEDDTWDVVIKDAVTKNHLDTIPYEGRYLDGQAALINTAPSVLVHQMLDRMFSTFQLNKSGVNPIYDRLLAAYQEQTIQGLQEANQPTQ